MSLILSVSGDVEHGILSEGTERTMSMNASHELVVHAPWHIFSRSVWGANLRALCDVFKSTGGSYVPSG